MSTLGAEEVVMRICKVDCDVEGTRLRVAIDYPDDGDLTAEEIEQAAKPLALWQYGFPDGVCRVISHKVIETSDTYIMYHVECTINGEAEPVVVTTRASNPLDRARVEEAARAGAIRSAGMRANAVGKSFDEETAVFELTSITERTVSS